MACHEIIWYDETCHNYILVSLNYLLHGVVVSSMDINKDISMGISMDAGIDISIDISITDINKALVWGLAWMQV